MNNLLSLMPTPLAPIALFVFNRPWHTRQTVEALQNNILANESDLFIYADGAKYAKDQKKVQEVREYIKTVTGFKSVTVIERDRNLGLAASIISGITEIINTYGRIIVLEDDLITSRYFLQYMNEALSKYASIEKVMHIAGYMFPVKGAATLPDTFFYRNTSCWGWGTWKRAWDAFDQDAAKQLDKIRERGLMNEFDIIGTINCSGMLRDQANGKLDSWAIRWYASVFLQNGLCLHPAYSLVNNIGHDGTGVHCGSTNAYEIRDFQKYAHHFADVIEESKIAVDLIAKFNRSMKTPFYKKPIPAFLRKIIGHMMRSLIHM